MLHLFIFPSSSQGNRHLPRAKPRNWTWSRQPISASPEQPGTVHTRSHRRCRVRPACAGDPTSFRPAVTRFPHHTATRQHVSTPGGRASFLSTEGSQNGQTMMDFMVIDSLDVHCPHPESPLAYSWTQCTGSYPICPSTFSRSGHAF